MLLLSYTVISIIPSCWEECGKGSDPVCVRTAQVVWENTLGFTWGKFWDLKGHRRVDCIFQPVPPQKNPTPTWFLFSPNTALLPLSRWLEHQFKISWECKALTGSLAPFPASRTIWSQMVLLCAFYTILETDCLFCLVFNVNYAEMIRQDSGPYIPILPSLCFIN